ncbi:MAG: phosphoadenosine phosphosulfate reductase family protein, partial [Candidatus Buchananbacteria bacterium]
EFKNLVTQLWHLNIKEYIQEDNIQAKEQKLWLSDPEKCCEYFKVAPTAQAIFGLSAWLTGLRNTEGETRKDFKEIEYKKVVKINPILDWTELDIWRYIAFNQMPIHPWYKDGYRSLGCQPCTAIIADDKSERLGRWQNTNKCGGECGIHTKI